MAEEALRIDKFLCYARLVRTRSRARRIADKGHIRLDGCRITSGHALVRAGDTLSVPLPREIRIIRIHALPEKRVSAKEVSGIYATLESVAHKSFRG